MRPCIAALAAAATLLAATGTGRAEGDKDRRPVLTKRQSARAAALRQRGLEHFLAREYQLASDDLMEAYRLDKRPETLFGWAEAVRAAGDCELASRIYRRLFEKTTDIKLTRQAEVGLAVCEGQTSASGGAEALASIAPVTSGAASDLGIQGAIGGGTPIDDHVELTDDAEPAPAKPAPEPTPHTTSYILLGSGGLLMLGGLVTYLTAGDGTGIPNATHAQTTSDRSTGDWHRLIGASIAVVGTGVALYGLLRYRTENHAASDHRLAVVPYFASSGGGVALSGKF